MTDQQQRETKRQEARLIPCEFVLDGFSRALVSSTWICDPKATPRDSHHILTTVDLVPDEIPRIDAARTWSKPLSHDCSWYVYSEQWITSSADAMRWFDRLVHTGNWAPPWRERPLSSPIPIQDLLNEPRWPSAVRLHKATAVPFATNRGSGARMHHVLSGTPQIATVLSDRELETLSQLLLERQHVDFKAIPELWQSAHFFQQVPIIRHASTRLESPDDEGDKAILVNLAPRRGASLSSLTIQVIEERATGSRLLAAIRPSGPFYRVPVEEEVGQVQVRVTHDDYGILLEEGPYAFLKAISISMNLIGRERRVKQPARHGRPEYVQRIPISATDTNVLTGSERGRSAWTILHAVKYRLKSARGAQEKQRWFRGHISEAETAIHKILSGAKRRALVVDPYFSAADVDLWLPSVSARGAQIQVLTSKAGLLQQKLENLTGPDLEREHLRRLRDKIGVSSQNLNATTVRIMQGGQSPIHDRFIAVDDKVWLLVSARP